MDKKKTDSIAEEAQEIADETIEVSEVKDGTVESDPQNESEKQGKAEKSEKPIKAKSKKNAEAEKLEHQRDEAISAAQRLQAEFDNFRKRNAKLRSDSLEEGASEVIKSLLPVIDNFERALNYSESDSENVSKEYMSGIKLVYRQLIDTLTKLGLEEIDATGMFDPNLHEAVMQDDSDEFESGMITLVLQKGYMVHNRAIRHTMVKVAK